MKRYFFSRASASVCLVLAVCLAGPAFAEPKVEEAIAVADTHEKQPVEPLAIGALLPATTITSEEEPLYAGTSTWILLSIALLGSITVKRRTDSPS